MSDRRRLAPLYWRFLAASIVMLAAVAVTGAVLVTRSWERQAIAHLTDSLVLSARIMTPAVRAVLETSPEIPAAQPLAEELGREARCRVTIVDAGGRVIGDSDRTLETVGQLENHADRPEIRSALAGSIGTSVRHSASLGQSLLYVAVPVYAAERPAGALRLAVPATTSSRWRRDIRLNVAAGLAAGLLVAALLSAWMALRLTRPMSRLARLAAAYARGDFSAKAEDTTIREVQELGDSLRAMAAALAEQIDRLTEERNQATVLLERLSEGVIAVDANERILVLNPAARRLLGLPAGALAGRDLFETIRQHEIHDLVGEVLEHRRAAEREIRLFHPHERWIHSYGLPGASREPAGPGAIVVLQDRTEMNRYEQLRREFVANVSHEIKTPLTSIRSLAETLTAGALEDAPAARRFVQLIGEDAERLSRLIDDLLALSRIESQAPPTVPVDVRPLAESVLESLRPALEKRRLAVTLDIAPAARVRADPDRVRQVLWNLIDNAIKYNRDDGSLAISASPEGARLRITVADTGAGIPPGDLERIFERFFRVDKARSRDLGGTGLGLSIVKHVVESYGGRIEVESRPGEGSRFAFTLPSAP